MEELETRLRRELGNLAEIQLQPTPPTPPTRLDERHRQDTQHHTTTPQTIDCPLLARFVATHHTHQAQANASTKSLQCVLKLVAQHPRELPTRHNVDALVRYHQSLVDARAPHAHARLALEALNTLEALRAHPPAHALFEQLCAPSCSEKACRIHAEYVGFAFAKRALLRYALGDDAEASLGGGGDLDAVGLLQDPRSHFAAIVLIASAAWLALQAIHGLA